VIAVFPVVFVEDVDAVLNGELDDVINALLEADKAAKLASSEH